MNLLGAASAVLTHLWGGLTHGLGGVTIEAAQFESTVAAIGDRVIEAQVDGPFVACGNRDPSLLFQGVYRCQGHDNWIAVSIRDTNMVHAIRELFVLDAESATDHDRFDHTMTTIAATHDADELARALQAVGVPASKVAKAPDLASDPHLNSRQAFATIDQPEIGPFTTPITPIDLSATPLLAPTPAPTLGQHNQQILLAGGFSPNEIAELVDNGTVVTEPPE